MKILTSKTQNVVTEPRVYTALEINKFRLFFAHEIREMLTDFGEYDADIEKGVKKVLKWSDKRVLREIKSSLDSKDIMFVLSDF